MTLMQETPGSGRLRTGFRSRAVAHALGGPAIPLGESRTNSPRLAVRWLRERAEDVADQLDASYARPVRAWLRDAEELEWALAFLSVGEPYVYRATDGQGTHYVLTAQPVDGGGHAVAPGPRGEGTSWPTA